MWFKNNINIIADIKPKDTYLTLEELAAKYNSSPDWLTYEKFQKEIDRCLDLIQDDSPNPHTSFLAFINKGKGTNKYRAQINNTEKDITKTKSFIAWKDYIEDEDLQPDCLHLVSTLSKLSKIGYV